MSRRQGIFWLLTIPFHSYTPWPNPQCTWTRGQLERGERGGTQGYLHWQLVVAFTKKKSLRGIQEIFGTGIHAEISLSHKANEYVWKEDTRVEGTQFEFGIKPINPSSKIDWEDVWEKAKTGDIEAIPASIRLQSYSAIRRVGSDFAQPIGMERTCKVYWGATGTGKSRTAWVEAGIDAYPKDPRTKWWCGYRGQRNVVIDEFRGIIDVAHLLRWLDRYPVLVEVKGGSTVLSAENIWITSNLNPRLWYPELDAETLQALLRRLTITHYQLGLI
nr:MAG: replication associated protein [Cressdnaviricota sp.]